MAVLTHLETDTGTNVDISAATAVGAYTSTGDKLIMVDVSIDAVAGNGDYVMYVTRQIGGSGSAYRILPQTTMTAASGLTAISGQSGWITVRNGDVLTCYVVGLAGDTSTPDWTTRWFELADTDISGLATSANLQTVDDNVDAIKAKTDQLTFTVANKVDATATTDTSNIAGDVWSYAKRTLTHPSVSAEEPEDSNTLILYRDADIAIELTDLTIPAGAKKYIFTIKDNLDGGDDQAVLQASYAIDGSEVETNTLVYINSAVPPALTNPVTFTLTETNITIDLTAEAAALLPRYERGYLNWDLKLVTDAAVTIVLQGLAQIIGTSTRAIE